jgi:2-isopropylmalate synthase
VDYALEVCNAVIDTWHPTPNDKMIINLPATVEVSTPNIYADQIEYMSRNIHRRDSIWISLHTHNDRGTAVAATELGLMAGADRVEGTLFGNGERTGNVDIVTLALNMYSQGVDPKLDFHDINETISVAEYCNNIPVPMRHPYAGELVYTAFSGSHQDAINKGMAWHNERVASGQTDGSWEVPYLPIDPRDLSRSYEAIIRINSQSGKGGIAYILQNEFGIEMPRKMHPEFSRVIQKKADETGMEIRSDQIYATFEEEYLNKNNPFALVKFRSFTSEHDDDKTGCLARIQINGEEKEIQGEGNGPIDAFKQAILPFYEGGFTLASYHEHSLSQGSDSKAIAYLEIVNKDYDSYFGVGIDTNITIASIKAMLSALNRSQQDSKEAVKEHAEAGSAS